jgi:succinate dehydrogenase / fumarate reductase cytochrome b subunit
VPRTGSERLAHARDSIVDRARSLPLLSGRTATEGPAAMHGSDVPAQRGLWLREVWRSTIGKKVMVAITGAILVAYVILHVLGNLKALQGVGGGAPAVDAYAEWLRSAGDPALPREGLLWTVRVVLLLAVIVHIVGVLQLAKRNRDARPPGSAARTIGRSLASRAMVLTGLLLLAFIVFHILHFTTRTIHPTPLAEGTVYANLYVAFQEWYLVLVYVGASALIGLHLLHGTWSAIQTAGWDKPNRNRTFRRFAVGTALLVGVGFALIPLAFWLDVLPEPTTSSSAAGGMLLPGLDGGGG